LLYYISEGVSKSLDHLNKNLKSFIIFIENFIGSNNEQGFIMTKVLDNWTEWLKSTRFSYMSDAQKSQTINWLVNVRDNILNIAQIMPMDTVLDIGTGNGLLAFGAYELISPSGKVIASDKFENCLEECKKFAHDSNIKDIDFLQSDANNINLPENSVDVIVMRSVLVHIIDKQKPICDFYRVLKHNGRLSFYEPVISSNTRYNELVDLSKLDIANKIIDAEEKIMNDSNDSLTNFSAESIERNLKQAGFDEVIIEPVIEESKYTITDGMIETWFSAPPSPGGKTMEDRLLKYLTQEEINKYKIYLASNTLSKMVTVKTTSLYCLAVKY